MHSRMLNCKEWFCKGCSLFWLDGKGRLLIKSFGKNTNWRFVNLDKASCIDDRNLKATTSSEEAAKLKEMELKLASENSIAANVMKDSQKFREMELKIAQANSRAATATLKEERTKTLLSRKEAAEHKLRSELQKTKLLLEEMQGDKARLVEELNIAEEKLMAVEEQMRKERQGS